MRILILFAVILTLTFTLVVCDFRYKSLVDDKCLNCLCYTLTGCNSTLKCHKGQCGVFKISWPYWADGEKPLLDDSVDPDSAEAFESCAVDRKCAEQAVQGYMTKYRQDCNGDGQVNCWDFAALHIHGGYGCKYKLPDHYQKKMEECLA